MSGTESLDVLVVSFACLNAMNRRVYGLLRERGLKLKIVVPQEAVVGAKRLTPDPLGPDGCELIPLELLGENPRLFRYAGLNDVLDATRPQCVYLDNDPVSQLAIDVGRWTRRHGARLVCQSCENLPLGLAAHWQRAGWRGVAPALVKGWLSRRSQSLVDHIFSINRAGADVFRAMGFRSVEVLPLGFDPLVFRRDEATRSAVRERLGLNVPVVGYFGRLIRQKGVLTLIEALRQLPDLEWRFMIDRFDLYRDPFATEVDRAIEAAGLRDRTLLIDANHAEIADYMNAVDVVVLASYATANWVEQYGRVIPEAMACGATVVVTRSGALPDLVGDCGEVVPENDADQLASTLRVLLINAARRTELATRGMERARARLSMLVQAEQIIAYLAAQGIGPAASAEIVLHRPGV